MKTDYYAHDREYKKRKAKGFSGWGTAEDHEEMLAECTAFLEKPYVPQSGRFLEAGCGAGEMTLFFAKKGYESYGLDISDFAIEWAKENSAQKKVQADFKAGNLTESLPYPNNHFDIILDGHCLHCIIGKDRDTFYQNLRRVLKPEGILHISTMCFTDNLDFYRKEVNNFNEETLTQDVNGVSYRYFGHYTDLMKEAEHNSFTIIHWEFADHKRNLLMDLKIHS